jgi:iron complex outermembrane receptor protein
MRLRKKLLLTTVATLATLFFYGQTVTGKIIDSKTGEPVSGVSVMVRSTRTGAVTGDNGTFSLSASANDVLEVSRIGYKTIAVNVNGTSNLNISFESTMEELGQIVLVGSRRGGRVRTESPVPIDVININQAGAPTAKMDLTSVLNSAAPSFNYNKQSGADGADHIDLGTLRGLGPDQTLVLINGKRRHQTAFVGLFGTRGRGNSGADLNAFPQAAVDRIEILRDGASAQYGSDAMAGVINIILKKDVNHWNINAGWSGYYDKKFNAYKTRKDNQYYYSHPIDGGTFALSVNNGFKLGSKGGLINISLDFRRQAKTFRQVADTNIMTNPDALLLNSGRRAFGDGSVTSGGGMYNLELPTGKKGTTTFYSFGGYNYKASDAFAYTRNWSARPDRFPVDNAGDLIYVPSIMRTSADGEQYYNPHIQTNITDYSLAAGIKSTAGGDWNWDLSNTVGRNDFHYYGDKTFNASDIGNITQTHFDDGGFNFLQNTTNLDFNKSFQRNSRTSILAAGAEFRYEKYSIYKGEEASYTGYSNPFDQAPGSQGFPGFSPSDEVNENRNVIGVYLDYENSWTSGWLVDLAVRYENYSDFGSVATVKAAGRYKISPRFNLRGSVSTGYRAPSLQQMNFSNTLTSFSGGQLVQSRIARNGDAITKAAGIPELKDETSVNASLGFTWKPTSNLTFTLDGYMVKVKDRIVLSGLFSADDNSLPADFTTALQNIGVSTAQFFDNAVNTTNYGIDIVVDYNKRWGNKSLRALLTGNIQDMSIDDVHVPAKLDDSYLHRKTFFSDREEAFLISSAPKAKLALNLDYTCNKLGGGLRFVYYGKMATKGFGWTGLASRAGTGGPGDPDISGSFTGIDPYVDIDGYSDQIHVTPEIFKYGGKVTTDIYLSYTFSKKATLFIGADNLFNVHPDFAAVPNARYESFDNETGGAWESVQMGFNGLRLFSRLVLNF